MGVRLRDRDSSLVDPAAWTHTDIRPSTRHRRGFMKGTAGCMCAQRESCVRTPPPPVEKARADGREQHRTAGVQTHVPVTATPPRAAVTLRRPQGWDWSWAPGTAGAQRTATRTAARSWDSGSGCVSQTHSGTTHAQGIARQRNCCLRSCLDPTCTATCA